MSVPIPEDLQETSGKESQLAQPLREAHERIAALEAELQQWKLRCGDSARIEWERLDRAQKDAWEMGTHYQAKNKQLQHYLSTACWHKKHKQCRKECKFCGSKCHCECHALAAMEEKK